MYPCIAMQKLMNKKTLCYQCGRVKDSFSCFLTLWTYLFLIAQPRTLYLVTTVGTEMDDIRTRLPMTHVEQPEL